MMKFDRIVLVILAVGVWALVLSPQGTHSHPNDGHLCNVSGYAIGELVSKTGVLVEELRNVIVECSHF